MAVVHCVSHNEMAFLLITIYILGTALSIGLFIGALFVAGVINNPWTRKGVGFIRSSEYVSGSGMVMSSMLLITTGLYFLAATGIRNFDLLNVQSPIGMIGLVPVADINFIIHAFFTAGLIFWTIWAVGANIGPMIITAIFWLVISAAMYAAGVSTEAAHFVLWIALQGLAYLATIAMLFGGANHWKAKLIVLIPLFLWGAWSLLLTIFSGPLNANWSIVLFSGLDLIVGHSVFIILPLVSYMFLPRILNSAGFPRFMGNATDSHVDGSLPVQNVQVDAELHDALVQAVTEVKKY